MVPLWDFRVEATRYRWNLLLFLAVMMALTPWVLKRFLPYCHRTLRIAFFRAFFLVWKIGVAWTLCIGRWARSKKIFYRTSTGIVYRWSCAARNLSLSFQRSHVTGGLGSSASGCFYPEKELDLRTLMWRWKVLRRLHEVFRQASATEMFDSGSTVWLGEVATYLALWLWGGSERWTAWILQEEEPPVQGRI